MAKPRADEIEQVYLIGEQAGMTRPEMDEIAKPHIRSFLVTGVASIRSYGELRYIRQLIADAARRRTRDNERAVRDMPTVATESPMATPRQVDYILSLIERRSTRGDGGGFMTGPTDRAGVAALTKAEASTYIDSLTERY